MSRTSLLEIMAWTAAALLCWFLGNVELHSDDSFIVAGLILIAAGALALLAPAHAWRWGLLMGLSIPMADFYKAATGDRPEVLGTMGSAAALIAFVVAVGLIGAYMGVGVRRLAASAFFAQH